ncbi:MAG: hypothetical protein M1834_004843 [Cirrosporium novae-zelandiae]|nr:MAG: hypothetical protein M1834_004843 [Cirrosporium novae-zelandiae]
MGFYDSDPYQPPSPSSFIASTVLAVLLLFYLAPTPLYEITWNAFIFIIPAPILFAMDNWKNGTNNYYGQVMTLNPAQQHAAKSDAMRRVLALDTGGLWSKLQSSRFSPGTGTLMNLSRDVPPGLGNWDNSCYQNSILQGLASLRSYASFLDSIDEPGTAEVTNTTIVALRDIIHRLNDSSNNGRILWTPAELKSMSSWQQQDAQEYFSKILDEVEKEVLQRAKLNAQANGLGALDSLTSSGSSTPTPTPTPKPAGRVDSKRLMKRITSSLSDKATSLRKQRLESPLEGLLAQRVGCTKCGYSEGLSLIPFNCLTVPLGRAWSYGVQDCLDEYTALESIEGVECAKCTLLSQKGQLEKVLQGIDTRAQNQVVAGTPGLSDTPRRLVLERLETFTKVLESEDFSDNCLSKVCRIPQLRRTTSTKSKQAVIARAPKDLVIHVNRSIFDEYTGEQKKNYADVTFPAVLDLGPWCLGSRRSQVQEDEIEQWNLNPTESMLQDRKCGGPPIKYELRAAITHLGRHENGHYICWRKHSVPRPVQEFDEVESVSAESGTEESEEQWWRLSDDNVEPTSESEVLEQGSVFMLFYERIEEIPDSLFVETPISQPVPKIEKLLHDSASPIPEEQSAPNDTGTDTSEDSDREDMIQPKVIPDTDIITPMMRTAGPDMTNHMRRTSETFNSPMSMVTAN